MHTIAVVGNKGGIGKTTEALKNSQFLATVKGMRGALIDLDPQGNSSSSLIETVRDPSHPTGYMPKANPAWNPEKIDPENPDWDGISSIADIFVGNTIYPYPTCIKNLDCFPSFASMLEDAQKIPKNDIKERITDRLIKFIHYLKNDSEYQFIVIDTNPQFGPLTNAAIAAATHVLLPTELEQYGIDGTEGMLKAILQQKMRRPLENQLEICGIIPNKYRDTKVHNGFLLELLKNNDIKKYLLPPTKLRTVYTQLVVRNAQPGCVFQLGKSEIARKESERSCEIIYDRVFNKNFYSVDYLIEELINGCKI